MATKEAPHVRVDKKFVYDMAKELGPFGFSVYTVLCCYANEKAQCWPKQEKIADVLGMSRCQVNKCIKKLEEMKIISVENRVEKGKQNSNLYTILVRHRVNHSDTVGVNSVSESDTDQVDDSDTVGVNPEEPCKPQRQTFVADIDTKEYKLTNKEYKENHDTTDAESASQGQDGNSFYSPLEENPKPLTPSKEKNGLPYLRTRPQDLNTPRDPLYSALDLICRGNGTGSDKFAETLRELNRYSLQVCDLDEMAKMIREERGFKHLSPGHFTFYASIYVAEKEKQDDELHAAALRRQRQEERDRQQEASLEAYRKQAMADLPARQEARKRKEEEDRRTREEEERVRFEKRMAGRKDSLGAFSLTLELLPKPLEQLSDEEFILFLRPHRQAAARQLMARASPQRATMGGATA